MESGNIAFGNSEKEEKVFVGIVDEEEEKVLHLREAQRQKGEKVTIPITMLECIERGAECFGKVCEIVNWAKEHGETAYYPLNEVKILAPIPRPRKNILCVGKNYREHAMEMGGVESIPENIMIFTKAPTTVIGIDEKLTVIPTQRMN